MPPVFCHVLLPALVLQRVIISQPENSSCCQRFCCVCHSPHWGVNLGPSRRHSSALSFTPFYSSFSLSVCTSLLPDKDLKKERNWKGFKTNLKVQPNSFWLAMVKCLIRIKTKVNVHLRMINHCYRDVNVRVLSMGPRLLGKVLGVLPLFPALPGESSTSRSGSGLNSRSSLTVPCSMQQGKKKCWF